MIQTKTLKEALKDPGVIEVVEELIGNIDTHSKGLMPANSYIRRHSKTPNAWHLIVEVKKQSANIFEYNTVSYLNQKPLKVLIQMLYYDKQKYLSISLPRSIGGEYDPSMKYKFSEESLKIWGKFVDASLNIMQGYNIGEVMTPQSPDDDAIDITNSIEISI